MSTEEKDNWSGPVRDAWIEVYTQRGLPIEEKFMLQFNFNINDVLKKRVEMGIK